MFDKNYNIYRCEIMPKELDYAELGFKCGIEIHQQLEGKKLFCGCPCEIRKDEADFEIVRRLRASAGESGNPGLHRMSLSYFSRYLHGLQFH